MQSSDKSPTSPSEVGVTDLRLAAISFFARGYKASAVAAECGIPWTTAIGWFKKWTYDKRPPEMGRPRKLSPYNETEVMTLLKSTTESRDWREIEEIIWRQSGDRVDKRSIYRLMKRWGLILSERSPAAGMYLMASKWTQPPETIYGSGLHAIIWRLLSGRGMEAFMFTDDQSVTACEAVAGEVVKVLKNRLSLRRWPDRLNS